MHMAAAKRVSIIFLKKIEFCIIIKKKMDPVKAIEILRNIDDEAVYSFLSECVLEWKDDIFEYANEIKYDESLTQLCRIALEKEHLELYLSLTRLDFMPYGLDVDEIVARETQQWVDFMNFIMNCKNVDILMASLRFFRTGVRESMWTDYIDYLISLLRQVTIITGINSVIRIVFNQSPTDVRHIQLFNILNIVWTTARSTKDAELYFLLLDALFSEGSDPLKDSAWTEHTVRNLISETLKNDLKGQFNYMSPTKTFCRHFKSLHFDVIRERINSIKE
jgi:hypothetical protein